MLPHAYTIPRKVSEKADFVQIRTGFDLNFLLADSRAPREPKTTPSEPLSLETLMSDAGNTYMSWDGT